VFRGLASRKLFCFSLPEDYCFLVLALCEEEEEAFLYFVMKKKHDNQSSCTL
jgi:hypothetical protein